MGSIAQSMLGWINQNVNPVISQENAFISQLNQPVLQQTTTTTSSTQPQSLQTIIAEISQTISQLISALSAQGSQGSNGYFLGSSQTTNPFSTAALYPSSYNGTQGYNQYYNNPFGSVPVNYNSQFYNTYPPIESLTQNNLDYAASPDDGL